MRAVANNLSWAEEKSAVALANYVPHISQEGACIVRLGAPCLVIWPDNFSLMEEEEHEEGGERGEAGPELPSTGA